MSISLDVGLKDKLHSGLLIALENSKTVLDLLGKSRRSFGEHRFIVWQDREKPWGTLGIVYPEIQGLPPLMRGISGERVTQLIPLLA